MNSSGVRDLGLLVWRLAVGGVLLAHGAQKLFGWYGGHGLEGTGRFFHTVGFRPGKPSAAAAGLIEAGGGALIALGAATPAAGASVAGEMVVAASIHAPNGFFATNGGFELPALLGASAAALSVAGPGAYSVDAVLGNRYNRGWMAAASLRTSSAGAATIIGRRQRAVVASTDAQAQAQAPADSPETPAAASPANEETATDHTPS
jgi:putative oxidoreductase